ncbi:MAG: PIN domain nuclease [Chloroflexota bacterium]|nr:PIN domain nuclease [Chloroflexota bacterium]
MRPGLIVKAVSTVALMLVGWQVGGAIGDGELQPRHALWGMGIGAAAGIWPAPILVHGVHRAVHKAVSAVPVEDLVTYIGGLVVGLVVAALLSYPLSFLPSWFGHVVPVAAAVFCGYIGISLTRMHRRELMDFLRHGTPTRTAEPAGSTARCLVDTSAIIDGRIADIGETGFLPQTLVIPHFILKELQNIADSADPLRRQRGRQGLETLNRLKNHPNSAVEVTNIDARDVPDVDGKLVTLGRELSIPIVTNDFNLNRVAELHGVQILNINQLAHAVKPMVLPGEDMTVQIIQEGKERQQGVGYLTDGTMIVVENGRRHLHLTIEVVVTRVLQTVAGRMIFAHPKGEQRE